MKYEIIRIYHGQNTEEEKQLSLIQICDKCRATPLEIMELVNEGIINPEGERWSRWRFSVNTLDRILKVLRLKRDLELNLAGTALAIQLLGKIEELESQLRKKK